MLLALLAGAGCNRAITSVADFPAQRERMVKEQIAMRGVTEESVLAEEAALAAGPLDGMVTGYGADVSHRQRKLATAPRRI